MGMLMHHTWLEQQKTAKASAKPIEEPVAVTEPEEEMPVKEPEPAKKPGRRKVSK